MTSIELKEELRKFFEPGSEFNRDRYAELMKRFCYESPLSLDVTFEIFDRLEDEVHEELLTELASKYGMVYAKGVH